MGELLFPPSFAHSVSPKILKNRECDGSEQMEIPSGEQNNKFVLRAMMKKTAKVAMKILSVAEEEKLRFRFAERPEQNISKFFEESPVPVRPFIKKPEESRKKEESP